MDIESCLLVEGPNMIRSEEFSRSQIDRLGDRLRKDTYTDADLRLLDSYRRSFTEASEHVVKEIRDRLGLEPTARPAKSKISIADKLRRESIRLSQIQDIAGCRLTVADIFTQNEVVAQLKGTV
jgi:putative GTP pyrophosphokinase